MKTLREKIEVMLAAEAGKTIQLFLCEEWKDWNPTFNHKISWDWQTLDYRVKPESKKVPYIPSGIFVVRIIGSIAENQVGLYYRDTIMLHGSADYLSKDRLARGYEWSSDRVTWHPFWREET